MLCLKYPIPQRIIVIGCLILTMVAMYGTNTCVIFTMDKIVVSTKDTSKANDACKETGSESAPEGDRFSWSYADQKTILVAFLPGYLITHIPGGILADNLGGKFVLFVGLVVSGIISIATPFAISNDNYFSFVLLRFIMGLVQGPMYPCVFAILSNWIQRSERGLFGTLLFISGPFGSVLSNIIAIMLKGSNWKILYFLWGGLSLFWSVIYVFFCFASPFCHPRILPEELLFLEQNVGKKQILPIPWKKFFTSSATWGFLCGYVGFEILHCLYVLLMPDYFYNVLKYQQSTPIRLVPTLLYSLSSLACGIITDKLVVLDKLPLIKIRRIMTTLGTILPSILVTGIPLLNCDNNSTYYLYLFGMLFLGFANCGIRINVLDISRNFVGFTLGVGSSVGNIVDICFPKLIDMSLQENVFHKWQSITMYAFFDVVVLSSLYSFIIKTEPQEWDKG